MMYLIYPSEVNSSSRSTCNCYEGSIRHCEYDAPCILEDPCGIYCGSDCWALICGLGVARRTTTG